MSTFADTFVKFNTRTIQVLIAEKWKTPMTNEQTQAVLTILKKSKRLERLDVVGAALDMKSIILGAIGNPRVKHVVLKDCVLHSGIFEKIAESKTLETLEIHTCLVLDYHILEINPLKSIGLNTSITHLSLVGFEFIGNKYVDDFEAMLRSKDGQLESLEIGLFKFEHDTTITNRFISCLKGTRKLKKLFVHIMCYNSLNFSTLVDLSKTNRSITELVVKVYQRHWSVFSLDFIDIWSHNISLTTIKHIENRSTETVDQKNILTEETRGLKIHRTADRWWSGPNIITKFQKDPLESNQRYIRDDDLLRGVTPNYAIKGPNLTSLVLINCQIRSRTPFPDLDSLENLDLSDNCLLDKFDTKRFPSLKWLKLSRCDITSFRHMDPNSKLAVLFIDYNPIEKYPIIFNSPSLEELYCAGCPFATPSPSGIDYSREQGRNNLSHIRGMHLFNIISTVSKAMEVGFDIPSVLYQFNKKPVFLYSVLSIRVDLASIISFEQKSTLDRL